MATLHGRAPCTRPDRSAAGEGGRPPLSARRIVGSELALHRVLRVGYEAAAQLARASAAVAGRVADNAAAKAVRALRARHGIRARYSAWGDRYRDESRPLLWMHAPSVGEGLQAKPVLELLRRRRPEIQLAYTHFSPSAERLASSLDVDFRDYL